MGTGPASEHGVTFFRWQDENVGVGMAMPPTPHPAGAHKRRTLHWVLGCGSVCWIRVFGCSRAPHPGTGSGSGKTREGRGALAVVAWWWFGCGRVHLRAPPWVPDHVRQDGGRGRVNG